MQTFRGSASTDLRGRIGRALRVEDVLGVAVPRPVRPGRSFRPPPRSNLPLRLLPGPQASREALSALTRQTFRVGQADRMGLHLLGGVVPGGEVISEAVPLGAVQVPPGGTPTLLLNDRGTLGGYAKPALLHPADLPRAAHLRPGEYVRFTQYEGR
jgi:allophanate hydrolase subunit 2